MTDVTAGQTVTLLGQFFDFQGGALVDLDATPTIAIVNIGTAAVALAATTAGVTHPGTGSYGYAWTAPLSLAAGTYLATWSGTKAAAPVAASETLTVYSPSSTQTPPSSAGIWYCTREDVKTALDLKETARSNGAIDRAIQAGTDSINSLCQRRFAPTSGTRYFDWPNHQYARAWRLWLEQNDVIAVTSLVSGGVTIPTSDYNVEPVNSGPPFNYIEMKLSSSSAFSAGPTFQRSIAVTGLWGYGNDEAPAGTVAVNATASAATIQVTDSASIGVGQLIRIGAERLQVTEKAWVTTGQTLQTPLTASQANQTVAVTDGTVYTVGETLLLDAERMLIVDIAGNNLTVKRAWDGSTLAAHSGSTIYAPRRLTVTRGVLGTTAAAMNAGDTIVKWVSPGLLRELNVAEAVVALLRESSGYAGQTGVGSPSRTVGGGQAIRSAPGIAIGDMRAQAYNTFGRKARTRAV
jgi:hypothetical protein